MRRVVTGLVTAALAIVAVLVVILGANTSTVVSHQIRVDPVQVPPASPQAVQNLRDALTHRTLSSQDGPVDPVAFEGFRDFLHERYPRVYHELQLTLLAEHTILLTWQGSNPDLPHIVSLAHQDVVPIDDPDSWTHPPFESLLDDQGYVWGRGAIDDKGSLIAHHEAINQLLEAGYAPARTLHFVFSHDEELGGSGARAASAWLRDNDVQVEAIFDEGLIIADGLVPGVPGKIGLIGVVERGYVTLELVAHGVDGHASMPPPGVEGAVAILASAIRRLEENPLQPSLDGPASLLFDWVGPEMEGINRVVFANRWLFGPVIISQMTQKASANASLRTTFVPTMLSGSPQENVMPSEAIAAVNFRLHPRDTVESIIAWVEETIDDDRVEVRVLRTGNDPSKLASVDSRAFRSLQTSFAQVFPEMPIAPGLFVAATDSRWLQEHTDDIYRFQPVPTTAEDLGRIHGVDERLHVDDFGRMITLYRQLFENVGGN